MIVDIHARKCEDCFLGVWLCFGGSEQWKHCCTDPKVDVCKFAGAIVKLLMPLLLVLAFALPAEARIWKPLPLRYLALPVVVPWFVVKDAYCILYEPFYHYDLKTEVHWDVDHWLHLEDE